MRLYFIKGKNDSRIDWENILIWSLILYLVFVICKEGKKGVERLKKIDKIWINKF